VRSLGVYEVNAVDISGRYVKAKLDLSETSSIASVLTTQFEWQTLGGQTPTGHKPNLRGYLGDRAALKDKSQMYELYLQLVKEGVDAHQLGCVPKHCKQLAISSVEDKKTVLLNAVELAGGSWEGLQAAHV